MKNLKNYCVQEMKVEEMTEMNGGTIDPAVEKIKKILEDFKYFFQQEEKSQAIFFNVVTNKWVKFKGRDKFVSTLCFL